jgi:holin-like protein
MVGVFASEDLSEAQAMIGYVTLLLSCQLLGEAVVALVRVPVPGPVAGMALLFCGLCIYGKIPDGLTRVTDGLLGNLSLLFVPAGVGVMLHAPLLRQDWLAISVALVVSTLATIAVTSLVMQKLGARTHAVETRP